MGLISPELFCERSCLSLFFEFLKSFRVFSNIISDIHGISIHSAWISVYVKNIDMGKPMDGTYSKMSFNCCMIQKIPMKMLHICEMCEYTKNTHVATNGGQSD